MKAIRAMPKCSIAGCGKYVIAMGWCYMHYARNSRNGSPHVVMRIIGAGWVTPDGYRYRGVGGQSKAEHVLVAERVLGRHLPTKAVVHHVDENPLNNEPANLVICPSRAYHNLLHRRMRAYDACGHADWRKCGYCKQYDDPKNMRVYDNYRSAQMARHAKCDTDYKRQNYTPK